MPRWRAGKAFNFWQDAANPKGLWRVTSLADYADPRPQWDVLLDLDALAAAENENWVFKGAERAPSLTRALVELSRGGGDAVVIREFDLETRSFVADGFALPEAKSGAAYLDDDRVAVRERFRRRLADGLRLCAHRQIVAARHAHRVRADNL